MFNCFKIIALISLLGLNLSTPSHLPSVLYKRYDRQWKDQIIKETGKTIFYKRAEIETRSDAYGSFITLLADVLNSYDIKCDSTTCTPLTLNNDLTSFNGSAKDLYSKYNVNSDLTYESNKITAENIKDALEVPSQIFFYTGPIRMGASITGNIYEANADGSFSFYDDLRNKGTIKLDDIKYARVILFNVENSSSTFKFLD